MKKILYHGTGTDIEKVDLNHSRVDIDFGAGFYLTDDKEMATLWAARKKDSFVIEYEVDFDNLKTYTFDNDEKWIDFVIDNRKDLDDSKLKEYDVIIGKTADDNPTTTIEDYVNDELTKTEAIELLEITQHSKQIVIKTEEGLKHLKKISVEHLSPEKQKEYRDKVRKEQEETRKKVKEYKDNLQLNNLYHSRW